MILLIATASIMCVKDCSYVTRVVGRTVPSHETIVKSMANWGETVEKQIDDWCFL